MSEGEGEAGRLPRRARVRVMERAGRRRRRRLAQGQAVLRCLRCPLVLGRACKGGACDWGRR